MHGAVSHVSKFCCIGLQINPPRDLVIIAIVCGSIASSVLVIVRANSARWPIPRVGCTDTVARGISAVSLALVICALLDSALRNR